jgi:hypothetical protein
VSTRAEDQRERALGIWQLVVLEPADDPTVVERVRRVLRLKRREAGLLAEQMPGPVRRGARADLQPLLERLTLAGLRAELVRRDEPLS